GQREQQPREAVPGPAQGAAAGRADRPVVVAGPGRLGRGAVPALPGRDGLTGEEGGGVAELRAVAEGGADVEDRVLADEDASADGDSTGLDGTGPGAVAAEVGVLADHAARADRQ